MRKTKFIAIIISIILVSVVVIPIAINESYKHGVVYVTKWDAADVLSFYGTLLGAATTAITLIGTIQFTRKQIQRNQFLEDNRRKWEKVESIITQALIDVSPLKILNGCEMDMNISPIANLHVIISKLQSYKLNLTKCRPFHWAMNTYTYTLKIHKQNYLNFQRILRLRKLGNGTHFGEARIAPQCAMKFLGLVRRGDSGAGKLEGQQKQRKTMKNIYLYMLIQCLLMTSIWKI